MLFDSINLVEGSEVSNLVVDKGPVFPSVASEGELFYNDGTGAFQESLYIYNGSAWIRQLDENVTISGLLPDVGTPGTYTKVTTNSKGMVVSGSNPTTLSGLGISDAQPLDPDLTAISALAGNTGFLKKTNTNTWALDTSNFISGNENISVTGDATGSGATSINLALTPTGVAAGNYGTSSNIASVTLDNKGRATAASNIPIAIDASAVTSGALINARISQSSVKQHEASLSINESQIVDGAIFPRLAGTETIVGNWTFNAPVIGTTPSSDSHFTTKAYVDQIAAGINPHGSVKVATTANITLSGSQTIDGTVVNVSDRVLVKNQTTDSQNGVYVVAAGAWARAGDFDGSPVNEVETGDLVFVEGGTTNSNTSWVVVTQGTITMGVTGIQFSLFSRAGDITAGTGLVKTGNTIDIATASTGRIVVNTDSIDLATTGVTSGTYTKLTVDSYGRATSGSALASSDVTTALGFTPYNSTNPNGYTGNVGTVTSVNGTGTVNGLTLTGTVTSSGNLALGGALSGIANSALSNSSVTIGSTNISLGGSSTVLTGLTSVTSNLFSGSGASLTNIPNSALTNSGTTINGTTIALGASGTVTAAAGTLTGTTLNATVTTSSINTLSTNSLVLNGTAINGPTAIEMGYIGGVANTSHIDFHTGAVATDYDSRIIATGGNGTSGSGTIQIIAGSLTTNAPVYTSSSFIYNAAGSQGSFLSRDGTGRSHWYWNTTGGTSPTFFAGSEDASDIMHSSNTGSLGTATVSISGTVLTASAATASSLFGVGRLVIGTGIAANTYITSFGTGTGGNGTYNVSVSQTAVGAFANVYNSAMIIGSISGTTLTVTSVFGSIASGMFVYGSGVTNGTYINALGTGNGGVGTYNVSISQTVASTTMACGTSASMYFRVASGLNRAAGDPIAWLNLLTLGTTTSVLATAQLIVSGSVQASSFTGALNGSATNVSGTVAIANGGTGQTTAEAAIDALGGAAINPVTPKDGDIKIAAGPIISIYASSAWRQIFPAVYS